MRPFFILTYMLLLFLPLSSPFGCSSDITAPVRQPQPDCAMVCDEYKDFSMCVLTCSRDPRFSLCLDDCAYACQHVQTSSSCPCIQNCLGN